MSLTLLVSTIHVRGVFAAQDDGAALRSVAAKITTEGQILPSLRAGGSAVAEQASPEPAVVFLALQEGAVAKARFGYLLSGMESIDATFSGPVRNGTAQFANVSGFLPGVEAKVQYQRVLWRREIGLIGPDRITEGKPAAITSAGAVFEHLLPQLAKGERVTHEEAYDAAVRLASGIQRLGGARSVSAPTELGAIALFSALLASAKSETAPEAAGPRSVLGGLATALQADASADVRQLAAQLDNTSGLEAFALAWRLLVNGLGLRKVTTAVLASGSYAVNHRSFTFVDDGGVVPQKTNRISRTWDAGIGFMRNRAEAATAAGPDAGVYLGVGISGGAKYDGQPPSTICTTYAADAQRCTDIAIGGPVESGSNEVTGIHGDARLWMAKSRFSIGFRPSYDRVQKVKRFEFPLYFIRKSKDLKEVAFDTGADFNGGLNVGWKSSAAGREFYAVFFVGSVFKLPGIP